MEMPPGSGNRRLLDVHGAGSQRSDPKVGDPDDSPYGHGPQGDVVRIYNFVRVVRDDTCSGASSGVGGSASSPDCSDGEAVPLRHRRPAARRGQP